MKQIKADRLFTLMPSNKIPEYSDDLALMKSAIDRVAEFIPVISEAEIRADELQIIKLDTTSGGEENE